MISLRKGVVLILAGGTLGFLALDTTATSQQNPAAPNTVQEVVGVSLVEVPVTVLDAAGKPVLGLERSDFEVFDEGRRVALESFDVSEFPAATVSAPPARQVSRLVRRKFLLLYDLSFASPAEVMRAREGGRRFVKEQMGGADLAAVATISSKTGLRLLANLSGDRARLAAAIESVEAPTTIVKHEAAFDPGNPGSRRGQYTGEEIDRLNQPGRAHDAERIGRLLEALIAVAQSLKAVDGRKQVILFSHGFDVMVDDTSLLRELDGVLQEFRADDCVLHSVDLAGISARDSEVNSRWGNSDKEVLFTLAKETGGHLMENSNDFAGQLDRILEATSVVYVLGFKPEATGHPGRFHKLEVKSLRKGVRVFARSGYTEPKPV